MKLRPSAFSSSDSVEARAQSSCGTHKRLQQDQMRMSEVDESAIKGVTLLEASTSVPRDVTGPEVGLRLRSVPGACLLFAGVLMLVGIGIAVGGYWPNRSRRPAPHHTTYGRTPSEKLKLVGAIIMGVSVFISICAYTLLYENRDWDRRQSPDNQERTSLAQSARHKHADSCRHSRPEASIDRDFLELPELSVYCLQQSVAVSTLNCSSPSLSSSFSSQMNFNLESGSLHPYGKGSVTLIFPVIKPNNNSMSSPEAPPLPEQSYQNNVGVSRLLKVEPTQAE